MADKSDGLLGQHHLLIAIIHTDWATRLDHKVAAVIIERYFGRHGNSRASLRYLEDRIGATRPNIIASTRRLVEHGAFSVVREGSGTRPTEYALNFDFAARGIADDTSGASSGTAHDTKTSLTVSGLQSQHTCSEKFSTAPMAPPADGLKATAADTVEGDEFGEFWRAWPRRHGKKKAQAEWNKLAPTAELASHIILTASAWAEHYDKHGVNKKWIPEPANWLAGERWDEDLPIVHGDAKGAAIAKSKANAPLKATDPTEAKPKPDFTVYPDEPAIGVIERVEDYTYEEDGGRSLTIAYRTHDGKEIEQFLMYESPDDREQERGQETLRKVLEAVDLSEINGAQDLIGCRVDLMINGKTFVSCSKPWVPNTSEPRRVPRFADVVANTPLSGWSAKIGSAYDDEDLEEVA
jgi:hypothetical protein